VTRVPSFLDLLRPVESFDARPAVEALLDHARVAGASDLHLRPTAASVEVLLRLDGVLQPSMSLPIESYPRLLVGIKNLGHMASYKKAIPQDGRLTHSGMEMRVATVPTHFGEKVVIRLVAGVAQVPEPHELGFSKSELSAFEHMVSKPQGLILSTGPAGSGKTTTILSWLRWLLNQHRERYGATLNVVTLEDPVECVLPELTQTAIQPAAGMTFASGLKSILRQDPEVIFVGEIRDSETAAAVTQCSLTGHLVFSSIHTRDSVGVIPRMLELGVEPYQLAAGLVGVAYQRLVRTLCSCATPAEPSPELLAECKTYGLECDQVRYPTGCDRCGGTGYKGRTAVSELLTVDDEFRQMILDKAPLTVLKQKSLDSGTVELRRAALVRVVEGATSFAEISRVIPS
jgi:type IV pilus assembly protein PilB